MLATERTIPGLFVVMALGLAVCAGCTQGKRTDEGVKAQPAESTPSTKTDSDKTTSKKTESEPAEPKTESVETPADKSGKPSEEEREALRRLIMKRLEEMEREKKEKEQTEPAPKPEKPAAERVNSAQPTPPEQVATPVVADAQATPQDAATPGGTPRIEINDTEFDFGEVWKGTPAKETFKIKNVGDAPLTIHARSSCGCTVPTRPKSPLDPGEETEFSISYRTSLLGKTHKTVTLQTNDPDRSVIKIPVKGEVKPLFKGVPKNRITFEGLSTTSEDQISIRLENEFDRPVPLKIRTEKEYAPFEVELRELEPGQAYELKVATKPPLRNGRNYVNVDLETDVEQVPYVTIPVMANVLARVTVQPDVLWVYPTSKQSIERHVRIVYRTDTPVKLTDVQGSHEFLEPRIIPGIAPKEGDRVAYHRVAVKLPPFAEFPEDGATLDILTNDAEFPKLTVHIKARPGSQRAAR